MPRLPLRALALVATVLPLAACGGDSITGPQRNARQMAARFDVVAESLYLAGQPDAADGASVLAEVLRMTDRLHTVTASVDGEERVYNALLVHADLPGGQCFPGEVCEDVPEVMQLVVGWRGEDVTDGFAFLMSRMGALSVPSPWVEGPLGDPPVDLVSVAVLGGMFERAGERAWLAASGVVRAARPRSVGACRSTQIGVTPQGVDCRVGIATFGADVGLYEATPEGDILPESRRTFRILEQSIAGLAFTITEIPDQMRPRLDARRILPMFQ